MLLSLSKACHGSCLAYCLKMIANFGTIRSTAACQGLTRSIRMQRCIRAASSLLVAEDFPVGRIYPLQRSLLTPS